ncbi:MAG: polysaccharide deacetylase family protein [Candidatus Omnitrophica bacterium]|nr:polysaccharide deacetylase family protein [Candidatus Omnitrophota bacterium]
MSFFRTEPGPGSWKRALGIVAIIILAIAFLCLFYVCPGRVTPILMYHSISDKANNSLCVTPQNFAEQIRFLHERGYSVISLDALVQELKKGRRYLPATVVITFDDGFEDNFIHAFPVLAKYNMPATIFLITGYVNGREGYLGWDQVSLMSKNGIDLGGHTRNNVYLPSVTDERVLWDEVAGSKKDIEEHTGEEAGYFCYPTGGFNGKVKNAVKLAGYKGACTTNRGSDRPAVDVYELKRIKVTNSDMNKPFHFRAKLSGFYNFFRRARSGD